MERLVALSHKASFVVVRTPFGVGWLVAPSHNGRSSAAGRLREPQLTHSCCKRDLWRGQTRRVASSAPRYDERIRAAARKLDDGRQPIAEICRRVGRECDRLGLTRPSYVHLRRFIRAERERRNAVEAIRNELVADVFAGRAPGISKARAQMLEAAMTAELRSRS